MKVHYRCPRQGCPCGVTLRVPPHGPVTCNAHPRPVVMQPVDEPEKAIT